MKRTAKKAMSILAASALLALTLAGCGSTETEAPETTDEGTTTEQTSTLSGAVATNGSTSMEEVMGVLMEQFKNDNPDVSVTYDPTGSGTGIEAAANGTADIGLSSRALTDEEISSGLVGTEVALDGIAVIVNADSPVADLSVEQIAQIFTGEITNWSELGGADAEIAVFGREAGSGTRGAFEEIVGVEDACTYTNEYSSTGDVIGNVASNPNGIGYASLSAVDDTVKAVAVNGVTPSEDTVKDGSYEIQRPFVMVTKEGTQLSEAAQAFLDFAMSADAAEIIAVAGAVSANA